MKNQPDVSAIFHGRDKTQRHGCYDPLMSQCPFGACRACRDMSKCRDCCVSWKSQLQSIITISSTESEYIALCDVVKEVKGLQGMLSEAKLFNGTAIIKCDSQSAICLSKNPVYHERFKYIDIKYHFVRDKAENDDVLLRKLGLSLILLIWEPK